MVAPPSAGPPPPEDNKMSGPPTIKEERFKESPSPNDNAKSQPTVGTHSIHISYLFVN